MPHRHFPLFKKKNKTIYTKLDFLKIKFYYIFLKKTLQELDFLRIGFHSIFTKSSSTWHFLLWKATSLGATVAKNSWNSISLKLSYMAFCYIFYEQCYFTKYFTKKFYFNILPVGLKPYLKWYDYFITNYIWHDILDFLN